MESLAKLAPWIDDQASAFAHALERLVNLNTFTDNVAGVDAGMALFTEWAQQMGFAVEAVRGRHRLLKSGNGRGPRLLLIAHMDTVHPPDGAFQRYEPLADGFVRGPGIGDIKGGLLMGLWAMSALPLLLNDYDVQLIVSADEEKGSPSLKDWYLANEAGADLALCLEPGFPQGPLSPEVVMGVVEARKGAGRISFTLQGRAAHAGGDPENGLNAIQAMALRIPLIHDLNEPAKGITANVGVIKGGTAANTVAETCEVLVDFRYWTQQDAQATEAALRRIAEMNCVHNEKWDVYETLKDYQRLVYMPAMEKTPASQALLQTVLAQAERLGLALTPIARGGGSDANWISGAGVPVVCGMGAPAEGIHTTEEKIHLPSLYKRLEWLIAVIYALVK